MEPDLETATPDSDDADDWTELRTRESDGLVEHVEPVDHVDVSQPGHADTGTAAGVGGVTGAAIGVAAGPIGAALGAVGGMIVGAAAERLMHADDDARVERASEADYAAPRAIADPGVTLDSPTDPHRPGSPERASSEIGSETGSLTDTERELPLV